MASFMNGIISIVMAVVLITGVVIPLVKNTSTTNWTTAEITVFGLISLVSILGIVNGVAQIFGLA